jgi:hypothetical protein
MSPHLTKYIRHAEKFGVECVFETAQDDGALSMRHLARLRLELDAIEADRKRGRFTVGARRRRSSDETATAVLMLRDEGLVVAAIADKLGVTDRYVKRHLKEAGTRQNGSANAHGYAAEMPLSASPA